MTFIVFLIEVLFSFSTSLFLVYYFGNIFKQNIFVIITASIVWFFSFIVIFLLPLDISASIYDECILLNVSNLSCQVPYSYISPDPLRIIWLFVYWLLQLLSWLILPLFQSFVSIHYFSIWKRLLWAIIQNALMITSLVLICIVIMIFLIVKEGWNFNNIISMAVTASNVWVLFFLIFLVGYGLVEFPRYLLQRFRYRSYLRYLYFQIAKIHNEKLDAEINMQETEKQVRYFHSFIKYNDPLFEHMKIIMKNMPFLESFTNEDIDDFQDFLPRTNVVSVCTLEKLNGKALKYSWDLYLSSTQLRQLVVQTLEFEQLLENINNKHCILSIYRSSLHLNKFQSILYCFKWIWRIYILRGIFLAVFILSVIFSTLIFISEATIFLNQFAKVTILAYVIDVGLYIGEYFSIEFISILLLGYISLCAYFSVFRIRIFNKYRLCPNHQTNEFSLLFSAILLSRLITSMCLNFLYLVDLARLPSSSKRSLSNIKPSFFDIWGSNVPEIAVLFFIYFPLVMIFVFIITIFQLDRRLLSFLGFQQFIGDDELTLEMVIEGKQYVQIQKKMQNFNKTDVYEEYRNISHSKTMDVNDIVTSIRQQNSNMTRDLFTNFKAYLPRKIPNRIVSSNTSISNTNIDVESEDIIDQDDISLIPIDNISLIDHKRSSHIERQLGIECHNNIFKDI